MVSSRYSPLWRGLHTSVLRVRKLLRACLSSWCYEGYARVWPVLMRALQARAV